MPHVQVAPPEPSADTHALGGVAYRDECDTGTKGNSSNRRRVFGDVATLTAFSVLVGCEGRSWLLCCRGGRESPVNVQPASISARGLSLTESHLGSGASPDFLPPPLMGKQMHSLCNDVFLFVCRGVPMIRLPSFRNRRAALWPPGCRLLRA